MTTIVDACVAPVILSEKSLYKNNIKETEYMGELEEAKVRLEKAIARLETVSQRVGNSVSAAHVEGELKALRLRCAELENKSQFADKKLDSVIERLRSILEESNGSS